MSASEIAATEDSDTQSEDDVSVSEDSESKDELLLEFGDASNSHENDSKDSESEEEDELPKGARVNCYGRKLAIEGCVILANRCICVNLDHGIVSQSSHKPCLSGGRGGSL